MLLRTVRGSIRKRAATSMVISGVVESANAPRAAVVKIRAALLGEPTGRGVLKSCSPRVVRIAQEQMPDEAACD